MRPVPITQAKTATPAVMAMSRAVTGRLSQGRSFRPLIHYLQIRLVNDLTIKLISTHSTLCESTLESFSYLILSQITSLENPDALHQVKTAAERFGCGYEGEEAEEEKAHPPIQV